MSEKKKKYMKDQVKYYFFGLIAFFLLFIVGIINLILELPPSFLIIEIVVFGILFGVLGGIGYFCSRAQSKKYPKPQGDQSAIFEIKRPKCELRTP